MDMISFHDACILARELNMPIPPPGMPKDVLQCWLDRMAMVDTCPAGQPLAEAISEANRYSGRIGDKKASSWPKHPDGSNKKMGEMSPDERREQTGASVARLKREFEDPVVLDRIEKILSEA